MSKHFIISKEVESGVVRSNEDIRIAFNKEDKTVRLLAYARDTEIKFTELLDYIDTLRALAWALRDEIDQAVDDEQDNSLPDIVGDDTDHIK